MIARIMQKIYADKNKKIDHIVMGRDVVGSPGSQESSSVDRVARVTFQPPVQRGHCGQ